MSHREFIIHVSLTALLLSISLASAPTHGKDTTPPPPIELKTSQARLSVDTEGRVALTPNNPACPTPAPFRTTLWTITLAEGTNPFQTRSPITTRESRQTQVAPIQNGARILCDGIRAGEKTFDIQLDLTITVVDDEFRFDGTLINNTQDQVITDWKYPVFLGIEAERDTPQHATPTLLWPDSLGRRFPTQQSFGSYRASTFPSIHGTMQWFAFTHNDTGLYFGCHDEKCRTKTFAVAKCSSGGIGYDMSLKHHAFCLPGQRWQGPPTVLMPFTGPWYAAAKHYRNWVESWLDPLPKPEWVKDSSGWLLAILKQQNGDLMWKYDALEGIADLAQQRGLDTLGLFGWAHGGHDRYYPDYIPDPKMGGPEVLKASIKKVRQRGLHVILYANGQLLDSATEFYRLQGVETMAADLRGKPAIQMYNKFKATTSPIFVTACTAAPLWQQRMMELAEQAHALGANGILFDQLGVLGPKMCFNSSHGHDTPAADGHIPLLHKIAHRMRKLDPDFIVMTEGVVDAEQADVPYFHGCGPGFDYTEPSPTETRFPELFRYTYPHFVATQRVPNPFLTRNFANYACAYGLRFEIESRYTADVKYLTTDQIPAPAEYSDCNSPPDVALLQTVPCKESAQYMQQVAAFRNQHADLLLRGRFIDTEGITVDGPDIVAKAFHSDNHIGVILWNPTDQPHSAKVIVPNHTLSAVYTPETPETVDPAKPIPSESIRLLVWER